MYDYERRRSRKLQPAPEAAEAGWRVYCGILALWLVIALFAAVMLLFFGGGEQGGGGGAGHDDTNRNGGTSMSSSIRAVDLAVDLPYIGRKYQLEAESGDRLTVVSHRDARRDLYQFSREAPDQVASVVRLEDGEARQLAGIIGGLIDGLPPAPPPPAEADLGDSVMRWITIAPGWGCVGKPLPERAARGAVASAHLVAWVEEGRQTLLKLEPGTRLLEGMTLMVCGDRDRVDAFEHSLRRGRSR